MPTPGFRRALSGMILFGVLCATTSTAFGHAIWLVDRRGELEVVYGHGPHDDRYPPQRIQASAYAADGGLVDVGVSHRATHAALMPAPEAVVVTSVLDNGYWTEGPDGKAVNEGKRKVKGATRAGRFLRYNLAVLNTYEHLPEMADLPLRIIPLENPLARRPGDTLRVRVLYRDRPLVGAPLTWDYVNDSRAVSARTDANGEAAVPIRNDGLNVIKVELEDDAIDDPDADIVQHRFTLSFTLDSD